MQQLSPPHHPQTASAAASSASASNSYVANQFELPMYTHHQPSAYSHQTPVLNHDHAHTTHGHAPISMILPPMHGHHHQPGISQSLPPTFTHLHAHHAPPHPAFHPFHHYNQHQQPGYHQAQPGSSYQDPGLSSSRQPGIPGPRPGPPQPSQRPQAPPPVNQAGGDVFERKYQVGPVLGKGGFGVVYAGIRKCDGMNVALKHVSKAKISEYGQVSLKLTLLMLLTTQLLSSLFEVTTLRKTRFSKLIILRQRGHKAQASKQRSPMCALLISPVVNVVLHSF